MKAYIIGEPIQSSDQESKDKVDYEEDYMVSAIIVFETHFIVQKNVLI